MIFMSCSILWYQRDLTFWWRTVLPTMEHNNECNLLIRMGSQHIIMITEHGWSKISLSLSISLDVSQTKSWLVLSEALTILKVDIKWVCTLIWRPLGRFLSIKHHHFAIAFLFFDRFTGSPALYLECDIHMCHNRCPVSLCHFMFRCWYYSIVYL